VCKRLTINSSATQLFSTFNMKIHKDSYLSEECVKMRKMFPEPFFKTSKMIHKKNHNLYKEFLDSFFFKCSTFVGSAWLFVFFIPATTANDLRLRRISIPDIIHYIFCLIFILQKEPVFPFLMLSAKQGNYWYHFYNVFGMTWSLTGYWTQDLPHSKPAL